MKNIAFAKAAWQMLWQDAADIAFKYPSKIFGVFWLLEVACCGVAQRPHCGTLLGWHRISFHLPKNSHSFLSGYFVADNTAIFKPE